MARRDCRAKEKEALEHRRNLIEVHSAYGDAWAHISALIPGRTSQQCYNRWHYAFKPTREHGSWSAAEDHRLLELHAVHGNDWKSIGDCMSRHSLAQCHARGIAICEWRITKQPTAVIDLTGTPSTRSSIPEDQVIDVENPDESS